VARFTSPAEDHTPLSTQRRLDRPGRHKWGVRDPRTCIIQRGQVVEIRGFSRKRATIPSRPASTWVHRCNGSPVRSQHAGCRQLRLTITGCDRETSKTIWVTSFADATIPSLEQRFMLRLNNRLVSNASFLNPTALALGRRPRVHCRHCAATHRLGLMVGMLTVRA